MNGHYVKLGYSLLIVLGLTACSEPTSRVCPQPALEMVSLATSTFDVWREGASNTYHADAADRSYSGTLKSVVERAAVYLTQNGGGAISFRAGDFDLGSDWLELDDITDVTFVGQGVDETVLRNNANAATDTEVFDCTACDRLIIRDLTVSAGGPFRSTSDALDFDGGDDIVIERVRVTESRGRGIVFDGKGTADRNVDTADGNVVRDCVVTGVPSDGIQLLASNRNLVEGCTITDVGGTGIDVNKASSDTDQPNKQSNDNTIRNNRVENAGRDGIKINSGDRNLITGNTVLNSSDDVAGLDGIRIVSFDSVSCDDNVVEFNTAADTQDIKTQRYGLKILDASCHRTVVRANTFSGNLSGKIFDGGTNTLYPAGSEPGSLAAPEDLAVVAVEPFRVALNWTAPTGNRGVTGYQIQRDGAPLATVGDVTAYADTTVQPSTVYNYQVRARDAAGNLSPPSDPAPATTPGCEPQADL